MGFCGLGLGCFRAEEQEKDLGGSDSGKAKPWSSTPPLPDCGRAACATICLHASRTGGFAGMDQVHGLRVGFAIREIEVPCTLTARDQVLAGKVSYGALIVGGPIGRAGTGQ